MVKGAVPAQWQNRNPIQGCPDFKSIYQGSPGSSVVKNPPTGSILDLGRSHVP